jgi:oxygen-independent coproporphyrinogen III oxidase
MKLIIAPGDDSPTRPAAWTLDLPASLPATEVGGLYVHVPFCFHKCHYCDFYSLAGQTAERLARYVDFLLIEAIRWSKGSFGPMVRPRTVFIGGGTPSLLPLEHMKRLLSGLRQSLDLSEVGEWTVECNPATVDAEYCSMLRECGVDRLSFGAQSFDAGELKILERHHHPEDVYRSMEIARNAGFQRTNIDLIFAIPGQTMQSWSRSLEAAIATGTRHLSCYDLTYEEGTPMTAKLRRGLLPPPDPDLELEMLRFTRHRLAEAGIDAYEISNFATAGHECRHNVLYWEGGDYIGLGPSAASHIQGWRWRNRPHLGEWEQAVTKGLLPVADAEHLSPEQRAGEMLMLQLRLARGVRLEDVAALGVDPDQLYSTVFARLLGSGSIERTDGGFRLTDKGIPIADAIAAEFLVV